MPLVRHHVQGDHFRHGTVVAWLSLCCRRPLSCRHPLSCGLPLSWGRLSCRGSLSGSGVSLHRRRCLGQVRPFRRGYGFRRFVQVLVPDPAWLGSLRAVLLERLCWRGRLIAAATYPGCSQGRFPLGVFAEVESFLLGRIQHQLVLLFLVEGKLVVAVGISRVCRKGRVPSSRRSLGPVFPARCGC